MSWKLIIALPSLQAKGMNRAAELLGPVEGHVLQRDRVNPEAAFWAPFGRSELDYGRNPLRQRGNHSVHPDIA
jgi:hypothetical protein